MRGECQPHLDPQRESVGHLLALVAVGWLAGGGEKGNGWDGGQDDCIVIESRRGLQSVGDITQPTQRGNEGRKSEKRTDETPSASDFRLAFPVSRLAQRLVSTLACSRL
jgi:hypothetical protein